MVKSLLTLIRALRRAWLAETAGAVVGAVALYIAWGLAACLGGVALALLLKSYEIDG